MKRRLFFGSLLAGLYSMLSAMPAVGFDRRGFRRLKRRNSTKQYATNRCCKAVHATASAVLSEKLDSKGNKQEVLYFVFNDVSAGDCQLSNIKVWIYENGDVTYSSGVKCDRSFVGCGMTVHVAARPEPGPLELGYIEFDMYYGPGSETDSHVVNDHDGWMAKRFGRIKVVSVVLFCH